MYNGQRQATALGLLQDVLPLSRLQGPQKVSYLVLGNFNLHHPVWGGDDAPRDVRAEDLLDMMELSVLDNRVRPVTVTRDQTGSRSTIDLVLASYSLREQSIECEESILASMPIQTTFQSAPHSRSTCLKLRTLLKEEPEIYEREEIHQLRGRGPSQQKVDRTAIFTLRE